MAGKTPVHSGVIFTPKIGLRFTLLFGLFHFITRRSYMKNEKRQIPPLQVSHLPVPPAERRNQF